MNFTKKQVIISVAIALIAISCIIFIPAVLSAKNEDQAAAELSELYNDQFVVTKSTAGAFKKEFDVTVQSETSKIVYDFKVNDGKYTGDYYAENVNAKVNELLQPIVGEEDLVMANTFLNGLTKETSLDEAQVEKVTVHILAMEDYSDEKAQQVAQKLKEQFGEIPVELEVYVVEEARVFEGVKTEVTQFFQLSKIDADSFIDFKFHNQTYDF